MSTHWCHRCDRFVSSTNHHIILCPDCGTGFIEELTHTPPPPPPPPSFNPVIVLRNASSDNHNTRTYHLYYDDGTGTGLRPLPLTISDFLMGSGFDRLLHHLDTSPAASKSAVESLPVVEIGDDHVSVDSHCAVCKEAFEIHTEAREMPCKHIYHADCILPWLSIRNSCPVCRFELPVETDGGGGGSDSAGMTIWRLPGGGFAVGRFSGSNGGRLAERELPAVYTEMDGRFGENESDSGVPRRISWGESGNRGHGRSLGRVFRSVASFFRGGRSSGAELRLNERRSRSNSIFRRRQRDEWTFGV